ncbi:MtrAB system histidine kinase MtrB [Nocardioides hwasunensis]|uniref:Sensor histidine kinase MtrB n=1 Tax=Nocardioides hwasunensis TaxID=397258 RepID=A0ABR8MGC3_9ACTN|nr:MtrAB system histidine kinase MtrB [Nocardioides hwasunensis]MBD3914311.1 sensor N-terminal transmembrane domain-containing protein [Nocardioides hwasunensis]
MTPPPGATTPAPVPTGGPGRVRRQLERLPAVLRHGPAFWRRSLQVRVVLSTLVLSALVVGVVGWFLIQQTRDGLLEHRVEAVVQEAEAETESARAALASTSGLDMDESGQQEALVQPIQARGATRGFAVVLSPPIDEGARLADGGAKFTEGLDLSSVPESLEARFDSVSPTAWTYTDIRTTRPIAGLPEGPGIVVGSQVRLPADDNTYTLYYLYPLAEQQETLALVSRAMLIAGVPLLVLVALLTWLVTRQVVTPIRMARRVAERLAAGHLQERLRVRGEDDLARLAMSFNQMASNLQKQIRQLEELSRLQRRFVSDVSHELRTPITTVRMASDVIHDARPFLDPVTGRAAELLQKELDRFETLLADLLEISRFDAGAAVLEAEDVDLVDVARRVVDMTSVLAEQRGTRVVLHEPGTRCVAEADVRRVERIVRNLVTNAIDHAESHDVEIYLGTDLQSSAIAVRDHGVGLEPGESAMVFNRFWRADPARARTSGGTGLGLSISLEDTHLHGGWLQAWGHPGQGAQFRLTLPRHLGVQLRHSPLPLVPTDARESA